MTSITKNLIASMMMVFLAVDIAELATPVEQCTKFYKSQAEFTGVLINDLEKANGITTFKVQRYNWFLIFFNDYVEENDKNKIKNYLDEFCLKGDQLYDLQFSGNKTKDIAVASAKDPDSEPMADAIEALKKNYTTFVNSNSNGLETLPTLKTEDGKKRLLIFGNMIHHFIASENKITVKKNPKFE